MTLEVFNQNLPAIAASLALESDEHGIPGRNKVVLLHWSTEGIAERLDDPSIIWSGSVVQSEGFSTIPCPGHDRGFYAIDAEAVEKIQTYYGFVVFG